MFNSIGEPFGVVIDVTDFGAKGDGATDDASAIQAAIDYLKTSGGTIVFPAGVYLIKTKILFYSNQTLYFENATLLQGQAMDNLLMSYCASGTTGYNGTHDSLVIGATFDGSNYQTNNTLAGIVHAKNIVFQNCTFKNAYGAWHDLEINSSFNCKVINCNFEGSRKTTENGCMVQIDAINNEATWPWSDNRGSVDGTISKYISIIECFFHDCTISPAIGNHSTATDSCIKIRDCIFDTLTSSRGAINFQSATEVDIDGNDFESCTIGVGSSASSWYVRNNRFTDVTTAVSGNAAVHNNMVNGSYVS